MVVRQQLCLVRLSLEILLLFNSHHHYHPHKELFQLRAHPDFNHTNGTNLPSCAGRRDPSDRACCGELGIQSLFLSHHWLAEYTL